MNIASTIIGIGRRADLTVRHNSSHLTVRLPIDYVRTSTGLGYATTIHSAQGVSADTMSQPGTSLGSSCTRCSPAAGMPTTLYLQVVGDGDPHTFIRPDTFSPRTPSETLQQILARDETPVSASTVLRELNDPAARLFHAVQRYTDGLHVAAEQLAGPQTVRTARPSRPNTSPDSPLNPPGQPCEHTCSPSPPNPVNTRSVTC